MKRNKRRIDARLKPYLWERLNAIAAKLEATYTEVLETCLERGMNWQINKIRRELDTHFLEQELPPMDQKNDKTKPKVEQSKAKTQPRVEEEPEEKIDPEQLKKDIEALYRK